MVEGGNRVQGAERQHSSSGRQRGRRDWRKIKERKEFRGDRGPRSWERTLRAAECAESAKKSEGLRGWI